MAKAKKESRVIRIAKTRFDELSSLESNGRLHPQAVVDFARNPRTLLHRSFTWDDTKAARLYRLVQAREIIQAFVVTLQGPQGPVNVRAYFSLPSDRLNHQGYRRIDDILKDQELVRELVDSAMKELARVKAAYEAVVALAPIWRAAEEVARSHGKAKKVA